jgi:2,4-dienoyl-CoA reductase-like NADH-dependent reductase (Old Yellow Enzyme family)
MELTLSKPIRLECGLKVPNRLVKAAMAECLGKASENHLPVSQECLATYQKWAEGGWGLIITGMTSLIHPYPSKASNHYYLLCCL